MNDPAAKPSFAASLSNRTVQMTLGASILIAAASVTALAVQAGAPANSVAMDRAQVEKIVHDYILAHPEILPQAMERLKEMRTGSAINEHRSKLETPFAGAWEGAADGDVVLVEFFDYACGYCRAALPDISRLVAEDKRLKVVYRELPILSQTSVDAARVSLYAAKKGSYMAYHKALYAAGRVNRDTIFTAAQAAGIDRKSAEAAMVDKSNDAEVESNIALAQKLQASGTPTFVVGGQVLNGAVGYDALKDAIAKARSKKAG